MYLTNSFAQKSTALFVSIFMLFLSISTISYAQPVNDSCYHYQELLLPVGLGSISYEGHNSGATPELPKFYEDCSPGGTFSGLGADVWYSFTSNSSICLAVTVLGLEKPEFNILATNGCGEGYELICESGDDGLVTGEISLSEGEQYLLRISGGHNSDQGHFSLILDKINCPTTISDCLIGDLVEFTPLPSSGSFYAPGTEVEICYIITEWNGIDDNWIHAVQIEHADGWNLNTLTYQSPSNCNTNGEWNWYEYWTNCDGELFGPGFAYDSDQGVVSCFTNWDGQNGDAPGDNWGDGPHIPCLPGPFCWTIQVKNCDELQGSSTNLDITITVLGDGTSGSWNFDSCDDSPDEFIDLATGVCCTGEVVGGTVTENPISCPYEIDGNFVVTGTHDDLSYNISVFNLNDSLLFYYTDVSLPFISPMVLDTGFYGIIVQSPDAVGTGWCSAGFLSLIHVQEPFEIFTNIIPNCHLDSTQLQASIWPVPAELTYLWTGPNDFESFEQYPFVNESGLYHLAVRIGDCIMRDSIIVEIDDEILLAVQHWQEVSCDNSFLHLQATGVGSNAENYQWINAETDEILSPTYIVDGNYWAFDPLTEDTDLLLVGFNGEGCSDTLLFMAAYIETPVLGFIMTITDCTSSTVEVMFNLQNGDQIQWLDNGETTNPRIFPDLLSGESVGVLVALTYNSLACTYVDSLTIFGPGLEITQQDTTICPGAMSELQASLSQSYLWSTGETSASISVAPPPGEGIWYGVSIIDFYDCEHSDSVYVETHNLANAAFTILTEELTVSCQPATAYNEFDTYTWNFGDGTSASAYNPIHTYATSDEYLISLIIETRCGVDEFLAVIEVLVDLPSVAFTNEGANAACAPLAVQFINQSENAATYFWVFEGGAPMTSTEEHPTVFYNTPGIYPVTLNAINSGGEVAVTMPDYIEIFPLPTGSFVADIDTLTVNFFTETNNVVFYAWDFGDGESSNAQNPSHDYQVSGDYTVTLLIANNCGEIVLTEEISVDISIPTVGFTTAGEHTGCAPLEVQFINQSEHATSYLWEFDGGIPLTSTEENPVVIYETPGVYTVILTATNGGGGNALGVTEFIEIYDNPSGTFTTVVDMAVVAFFTEADDIAIYFWGFGDGETSNEVNPIHEYSLPGTYMVSLVMANQCGEITLTQEVVIEIAIPSVAFTTEEESSGCSPLVVQFINESENATSYEWLFEGGLPVISTEENPLVIYENPGVYPVTLTAANAGGENDLTLFSVVEVYALPTGAFTTETNLSSVSFFTTTENVDTYFWDFGDDETSEEANPVHEYMSPGTYAVSLTISNECGEMLLTQELMIIIDAVFDENMNALSFNLYPNPNEGKFWVAINNSQERNKGEFTVFNALGKSVFQTKADVKQGNTRISIDAINLSAGVYYLQLTLETGVNLLKKFVIL